MTKLTILGATAILSTMAAIPVFAQSAQYAQQEPAAFASTHPNAGVHSPTYSLGALAYLPPGKSYAKRHFRHR
ncbi:hypothetical protein AAE026_05700 [Bradyrhizobium sp. DN5]|uniref:hypothetical protein n=1 Tax=unclassified Bradyrhizobium TaxID=2631580 RepID=UPI00088716ED|nr:hypothetical protein [Bradyrhizobium sp. Rc2d]SDI18887.1 hypothetical protein SAMN05216338_1018104 [Bradyrhizobium sp. Rc2d]